MADGNTPIHAMIGLESHTPVGGRLLAERLQQRFPAYVEKLGVGNIVESPQPGAPIRLMIGPCAIEVYAMPQPIPSETLAIALATNRDWPQARSTFGRCHAHLGVVALHRKDGQDNVFLNAICVTLVSATLCDMAPAIGVFWPMGNRLSEARRFRDVAARMAAGEPAVDLWVQTLFTDGPLLGGQRTLCAMTAGLRPLVGREIELLPLARGQKALAKIVGSLLAFTARRGIGFDDGDSVDMGNGEVVCLRHAAEGQRSGIPIFEARLAKLDARGRLPADAFGDRPLQPRPMPAAIYELPPELHDASVAPTGVKNLQAVPAAMRQDGPRPMPAAAPRAELPPAQQPAPAGAPTTTARPKSPAGVEASRLVRTLRRPTSKRRRSHR